VVDHLTRWNRCAPAGLGGQLRWPSLHTLKGPVPTSKPSWHFLLVKKDLLRTMKLELFGVTLATAVMTGGQH